MKSLFPKALMTKNLYQGFLSSSSTSCVQWCYQRFDPGGKLSWKGSLVIVVDLIANTQKKNWKFMWFTDVAGYILKP